MARMGLRKAREPMSQ